MTLPEDAKIVFAPQTGVFVYAEQVVALLEILGHPEAWVSDESLLCDFMDMSLNAAECRVEIERLCEEHRLPATLHAGMTLVEACQAILADNPNWPAKRSIQ